MNDTTSAPAEQAGIPEQRLERLRALATTLTDDLGLTGTWRWFGDYQAPYLATQANGRRLILRAGQLHEHRRVNMDMDVDRGGCDGSFCHLPTADTVEPGQVFQANKPIPAFPVREVGGSGRAWNHMVTADEIPVFEVCRDATSPDDQRVYRTDVVGFRSPAAEWLAECDADTVLALLDEVTRLRVALAGRAPSTPLETADPLAWAVLDAEDKVLCQHPERAVAALCLQTAPSDSPATRVAPLVVDERPDRRASLAAAWAVVGHRAPETVPKVRIAFADADMLQELYGGVVLALRVADVDEVDGPADLPGSAA